MKITVLRGKQLTSLHMAGTDLVFVCESGEKYKLSHDRGCYTSVRIDTIQGDFTDVLHTPLTDVSTESVTVTTKPKENSEGGPPRSWTSCWVTTKNKEVEVKWRVTQKRGKSIKVTFKKIGGSLFAKISKQLSGGNK